VGFISQSAWACLEKDENLVETIRASTIAYAKPLKVAWGVQKWTLESNKCNRVKEMDAISKYHNSEIIHGRYISILIYIF
jgi:SUMO ligase MMS21 Smc5/6 complex component